ncbi:hypothetical protein EXIGLDRAFT_332871 [Exidia glandulosa HHB12029]|uniref:Uncharacterized protein n=1 Tax=Exidia glandulosa HHB12029 TaxID=1314781 RepID=A0A166B5G2_EXIGL|nr:hypothetical protein EXIGLDRAFT_332871 [Exidia glandulosa HHB12029]
MIRSSSTEVLRNAPSRIDSERDKRKRDISDVQDDKPFSKRPKTHPASPAPTESVGPKAPPRIPLHLSIVAHSSTVDGRPPMAMPTGHDSPQPDHASNSPDDDAPASTSGSGSSAPADPVESAEAADDDWDDWVFSRGVAAPIAADQSGDPFAPTSPSMELEDAHWAELERVYQITPPGSPRARQTVAVAPPVKDAVTDALTSTLESTSIASAHAESRQSGRASTDALDSSVASPSRSPVEHAHANAAQREVSPLTEDSDDEEDVPLSKGIVSKAKSDTTSKVFAKLAQQDRFVDFRARNIDGDRIQCNGCGRWMMIKSWEKHLKDVCSTNVRCRPFTFPYT